MAPNFSSGGGRVDSDFRFAFNDSNFFDRILKIEIIPDIFDAKSDPESFNAIAEWAHNRKRRREDVKKENDVVRDNPTNNVSDLIFSNLGMQLHRRDQHPLGIPLGILKNAIFDYFDTNFSNKFDKFDDLCPLVSTKQEDCFYDLLYNTRYQISVLRLWKMRDEIMNCTLSIYVDIYFD